MLSNNLKESKFNSDRKKIRPLSLCLILQSCVFASVCVLIFRTGLKGGPVVQLLGAPAYKGCSEVTGIIGNMMIINSGFHVH